MVSRSCGDLEKCFSVDQSLPAEDRVVRSAAGALYAHAEGKCIFIEIPDVASLFSVSWKGV